MILKKSLDQLCCFCKISSVQGAQRISDDWPEVCRLGLYLQQLPHWPHIVGLTYTLKGRFHL